MQVPLLFKILLSSFLFTFLQHAANAQGLDWAAKIGGAGTDLVNALASDKEGNVYTAGSFSLNAKIGKTEMISRGGGDFFVAKFNAKGQLLWQLSGGGPYDDFATCMSVDASGDVFVAGIFTDTIHVSGQSVKAKGENDAFLMSISHEGKFEWIKGLGSGGSALPQAIGSQGDQIYVGGVFTTNLGLGSLEGHGETDAFIAAYSSLGELRWMQSGGGAGYEEVKTLSTLSDGQVVLTGRFMNYAYFGEYKVKGGDNPAVFIASYLSDGRLAWVQKVAGIDAEVDIVTSASSGKDIYLAGKLSGVASIADFNIRAQGMFDALLLKFDADGTPVWALTSEGEDDEGFQRISIDESGQIRAVGTFRQSFVWGKTKTKSSGDNNLFQLHLDENQKVVQLLSMPLLPDVVDNCYALHADKSWLITGYFKNKRFFSKDYYLVAVGEEDIFLQKSFNKPATKK